MESHIAKESVNFPISSSSLNLSNDIYSQISQTQGEIDELKGKIFTMLEVYQPHYVKTSTEINSLEDEVNTLQRRLDQLEMFFMPDISTSLDSSHSMNPSNVYSDGLFALEEEKEHQQKQLSTLRESHKFIQKLCELQVSFTKFDKAMEAHALDSASVLCKISGELLSSLSSSKSYKEEPKIMQQIKLDFFQRRGRLIARLNEGLTQVFIFKEKQIIIHRSVSPNPLLSSIKSDESLLQPQITISDIFYSLQELGILDKTMKFIANLFISHTLKQMFTLVLKYHQSSFQSKAYLKPKQVEESFGFNGEQNNSQFQQTKENNINSHLNENTFKKVTIKNNLKKEIIWRGDIKKGLISNSSDSACWTWIEEEKEYNNEDISSFNLKSPCFLIEKVQSRNDNENSKSELNFYNSKNINMTKMKELILFCDPHQLLIPLLKSLIHFIYEHVFIGEVDSVRYFGRYIWNWLSHQLLYILPPPTPLGGESLKQFEAVLLSLQFITNSDLHVQTFLRDSQHNLHETKKSFYLDKARQLLLSTDLSLVQVGGKDILNDKNNNQVYNTSEIDKSYSNLFNINSDNSNANLYLSSDKNLKDNKNDSNNNVENKFNDSKISISENSNPNNNNKESESSLFSKINSNNSKFDNNSKTEDLKNILNQPGFSASWFDPLFFEGMSDFIRLPLCSVTKSTYQFVSILEELLSEAEHVIFKENLAKANSKKQNASNNNITKNKNYEGVSRNLNLNTLEDFTDQMENLHSDWEPSAKAYLLLLREVASLFVIVRPTSIKGLLLTDPHCAALFFTDCSYIAHKLMIIPFEYAQIFKSASFAQSGFYLDLILALRKLQEATLTNIMHSLKNNFLLFLTQQTTFYNLHKPKNLTQSTYILTQIINMLKSLANSWGVVFPRMIYIESMSILINCILKNCQSQLLSLPKLTMWDIDGLINLLSSFLKNIEHFLVETFCPSSTIHIIREKLIYLESIHLIHLLLSSSFVTFLKFKKEITNNFTQEQLKQLLSQNRYLGCSIETAISKLFSY